jgi:hypothetical protein
VAFAGGDAPRGEDALDGVRLIEVDRRVIERYIQRSM